MTCAGFPFDLFACFLLLCASVYVRVCVHVRAFVRVVCVCVSASTLSRIQIVALAGEVMW